jgi:hypothetical protein
MGNKPPGQQRPAYSGGVTPQAQPSLLISPNTAAGVTSPPGAYKMPGQAKSQRFAVKITSILAYNQCSMHIYIYAHLIHF